MKCVDMKKFRLVKVDNDTLIRENDKIILFAQHT